MSSTDRVRQWRIDNPDKARAIYDRRDVVAERERASVWATENPVRRKEIKDAYDERRRTDRATWAKHMINSLKGRCRKKGLPFDLVANDLLALIPDDGICPAIGIEIIFGGKLSGNSPSIDRIIPSLGYVRGNVCIISHKANSMKQDCVDPDQLRRLANFLEAKLSAVNILRLGRSASLPVGESRVNTRACANV